MNSELEQYDPNGIGLENGNFLGFPKVDSPKIQFIAVPFDATVSYGYGTSKGPENILQASTQLDVGLPGVLEPWKLGFSWKNLTGEWSKNLLQARKYAKRIIECLSQGEPLSTSHEKQIEFINQQGLALERDLEAEVTQTIAQGSFPIIIGGDHSISLGAFKAAAKHTDYGILQIDAHMDLRKAYEGLKYSHASIMYNAINEIPELKHLTQVGIRDYCPEEYQLSLQENISTFFDETIQQQKFTGLNFDAITQAILDTLPQKVWISLDIDGLDPSYCMHTGTPVPGGLTYSEVQYLCNRLIASGREVIGLDLVEVAGPPHEYEGAVAARLAYEIGVKAVGQNR